MSGFSKLCQLIRKVIFSVQNHAQTANKIVFDFIAFWNSLTIPSKTNLFTGKRIATEP